MREGVRRALLDRRRLGKFASVGVVGATIDLSVSTSLVLATEVPPVIAKFLGAEVAIVVMFLINDRWTFRHSETRGYVHGLTRLVKSNLVRSGGLAIQLTVVFVLTRLSIEVMVGGTDVWPALTMPIAIACGFVANYVGETLFTWRVAREL